MQRPDEHITHEILKSKGFPDKESRNALKEKMSKNTDNILGCLESVSSGFYKVSELKKIYNLCIDSKYIYQNTAFSAFETFLKEQGVFKKKVTLDFPNRKYTRYFPNEPNIYELALSINSEAFFSHYTAVHLHNLTIIFLKLYL